MARRAFDPARGLLCGWHGAFSGRLIIVGPTTHGSIAKRAENGRKTGGSALNTDRAAGTLDTSITGLIGSSNCRQSPDQQPVTAGCAASRIFPAAHLAELETLPMGEIRQPTYTDLKTGERKTSGVWWIRYYRNGRRYSESSHSTKKSEAITLLKQREGAVANGEPVTSRISRFLFGEAAADLLTEYRINNRRSTDEAARRIRKHLEPFFGGRRMTSINTADVRRFVAQRQAATEMVKQAYDMKRPDGTLRRIPEQRRPISGASNAEINRELTLLKRMFTLACRPASCSTSRISHCWRNATREKGSSNSTSSRVCWPISRPRSGR